MCHHGAPKTRAGGASSPCKRTQSTPGQLLQATSYNLTPNKHLSHPPTQHTRPRHPQGFAHPPPPGPHPLQHGEGLGDKFSVDYILMDAKKAAGGTPATGVDEKKWLAAFLKARYDLLYRWDYTSRVSVTRVTMYQKLLEMGEWCRDRLGVWADRGRGGGRLPGHTCRLYVQTALKPAALCASGVAPCPLDSLIGQCSWSWLGKACSPPSAGNLNLDGPIYIDLQKHTSSNGQLVWQIKDTYYGEHAAPAGHAVACPSRLMLCDAHACLG